MKKINLFTWFANRQVTYLPTHFIKCNADVTEESKKWVYEHTNGRFYIDETYSLFQDETNIYFEDSQEAMLYELKWS